MSAPIDPGEVRETAAEVARGLGDGDAQDVVDGLHDLLGE